MPIFEIEGPDGETYEVDAPDEQSAVSAFKKLDVQPQMGVLEDTARSLGAGLRTGAEGVAGMAGDVQNVIRSGVDFAVDKSGLGEALGGAPGIVQGAADAVIGGVRNFPFPAAPTREQVTGTITDPILGAERHQPQTLPGEFAETIGEFAPAMVAGPGGIAKRAITQTVIPAVSSELAGQATKGTALEPFARVAGAVGGSMLPSAAKRLITPFPTSPSRQAAVDVMKREGVDLTAGQATGSRGLRFRESELGGRKAMDIIDDQGEQFTSAILRRVGVNAKRATPDVIDDTLTQIGKQFDDLAARNSIAPDKQLAQEIRAAIKEYKSLVPKAASLPTDTMKAVFKQVREKGQISGDFYKAVRSKLNRTMRGTKEPELRQALRGIQEALDDAMERTIASVNPKDSGAWQEVRSKYRNMLVVEKAATGAGENAAQGIISPSALRNAVVNQGRRAYARGKGDFADLARAGEATMKPLPDSGTASRYNARNLGAGITSILGAGGGATVGGAPGAMAGALAGAALPGMAGRAMLSGPGRAYLGNQMMTNLADMGSPSRDALIAALLSRPAQPPLPVPTQ